MKHSLEIWRQNSPWTMINEMDRIFNRFLQPTYSEENASTPTMVGFNPACDVDEQDDHFLITMDLPGVSKDDVKIEIVDNRLVISGERKSNKKEQLRGERFYGRFERSLTLPTSVDSEKIEARYENGVLELAVPKAEVAKPRTVQIQTTKEGFLGKFLGKNKTTESGKKAGERLVS